MPGSSTHPIRLPEEDFNARRSLVLLSTRFALKIKLVGNEGQIDSVSYF